MIEEIKFATHEEWAASRKGLIGASAVPAILGISPFSTPLREWRLLRGEILPAPEDDAMHMGHLLEPIVAQLFCEKTGMRIKEGSEAEYVVRNSDYPFSQVSPDRVVVDSEGNEFLLECKTTSKSIGNHVPVHWQAQVLWQLAVSGAAASYIAWLSNGRDFGFALIERDEETIEWMAAKLRDFYETLEKDEAEPLAQPCEEIAIRFPAAHPGESLEASEEVSEWVADLAAAKDTIAQLEERADELAAKIKMKMKTADTLISPTGEVLATWKNRAGGKGIDARALALKWPEAYRDCLVEKKSVRTFLLKK